MQDGGERKRDRSDESCDEACDVSNESEMTTAQMQTCKKLTASFGCFARAVCDERNGKLFPH